MRYVAYDLVQDQQSVVTVELNADSIKWITQVYVGLIDRQERERERESESVRWCLL